MNKADAVEARGRHGKGIVGADRRNAALMLTKRGVLTPVTKE